MVLTGIGKINHAIAANGDIIDKNHRGAVKIGCQHGDGAIWCHRQKSLERIRDNQLALRIKFNAQRASARIGYFFNRPIGGGNTQDTAIMQAGIYIALGVEIDTFWAVPNLDKTGCRKRVIFGKNARARWVLSAWRSGHRIKGDRP